MQITGPTGTFHADGAVADYWLAQPGYAEAVTPEAAEQAAEELKGDSLDAKVEELGLDLPSDAKANEKRAAVAAAITNTPED